MKTKVIAGETGTAGTYPVTMSGGKPVFYLAFNPQDIQKWVPDTIFILMVIAALLASIWWLQLMIIYIRRNTSPLTGFVVTLSVVVLIRIMLFVRGLPFNIDALTLFDPALYASSKFLSSLGDLLIDTLCILWLVTYIIRHTSYRAYFKKMRNKRTRMVIATLLSFILIGYFFLVVNIFRGLVLDSNISFDVSHFYAINVYTLMGLLVVGSITGMSCLVIYLLNLQLMNLLKRRTLKYLFVAAAGILSVVCCGIFYNRGVSHYHFEWLFYGTLFALLVAGVYFFAGYQKAGIGVRPF